MHSLSIKAFDVNDELQELYWFGGIAFNGRSDCFIRTILRGSVSGKFKMCQLPIGNLPFLTLGQYFQHGHLLEMTTRGTIDTVTIKDLSDSCEISSNSIPQELYSFGDNATGKQKLLLYELDGLEIFIPTTELIRYLFLHNKTLANAIMKPAGLMTLYKPKLPKFNEVLNLDFSIDMPKASLTNEFVQEFAWIVMTDEVRKSWDSVLMLSLDQTYFTLTPPSLKNTNVKFRGIRRNNQIMILEILQMTGKTQPCNKLIYTHPLLKKTISVTLPQISLESQSDYESTESKTSIERFEYFYELHDDGEGVVSRKSQKIFNIGFKESCFERSILIERLIIDEECNTTEPGKKTFNSMPSEMLSTPKRSIKINKVSAGEICSNAELKPIEFGLLIPGFVENYGDLSATEEVIKLMAGILPDCQFSMAICQLKQGRTFSNTDRHARLAMITTIYSEVKPPICLIDVDHSGNIALSPLAIFFNKQQSFEHFEPIIKKILDGLVDNSGHWDSGIEGLFNDSCLVERFPKIISRECNDLNKSMISANRLVQRLSLNDD